VSDATVLPVYSEQDLAGLDPTALVALMVGDEDRVPRNVIDACAARGEAMVAHLRGLLDPRHWMDDRSQGQWWLLLHAVMILGLIPGEPAGLALADFMHRMAEEEDDDLQDWFAGRWPALFANKPASVVSALRALCEDRSLDWYMRVNAAEPVIAAAQEYGGQALDEALDWAAKLAADEQEEWMLRLCLGNTLLDFPREAYRPLLEDLAARQVGLGRHFTGEEVHRAYAAAQDRPEWRHFKDPWVFYSPEAIAWRQERWAEEDAGEDESDAEDEDLFDEYEPATTYVRDAPRIGRNDPCPCGSGKKYKKCCLARDQA
jgi:hypothetical protein